MRFTCKITLFLMSALLAACAKEEVIIKPAVTSNATVTNITGTSATFGGNLVWIDGYLILNKGICYSTTPNPTIEGKKVLSTTATGPFTCRLSGLNLNTTYYVRTFATYSVGETGYGNEISFRTSGEISFGTASFEFLAKSSIKLKDSIFYDGGVPITIRGVCYDTLPNPTYPVSSHTTDGTGFGMYFSTIDNLKLKKTYYAKPYIVNSNGTSYGSEFTFSTVAGGIPGAPIQDYDGNTYNTIILGNQTWMTENLKTTHYNNGEAIPTLYGVTVAPSAEPRFQWIHKNNQENLGPYGRLYTWYTATDTRGIAPEGWRVPSWSDWQTLVNYLMANGYGAYGSLHSDPVGKAVCSKDYWLDSNTKYSPGLNNLGNNFSGLSLVPGGKFHWTHGFIMMNGYGCYMSTTAKDETSYDSYMVQWDVVFSRGYNVLKNEGLSVRCVKIN